MGMGDFPEPPPIREVLEHYGIRTTRRMTLCPFHEDTVPSFSVDYNRGLYNCHACGAKGNTWTLIMKKEDINFSDAIRFASTAEWISEDNLGEGGETLRGSAYGGGSRSSRRGSRKGSKKNTRWRPSWDSR